ncbi:recombinase family protein [bacterium]|nr:recombinase family protein [bacterium]
MKDNKLKYIMYCRKSTESEDRQVQSIESQKEELNKLVKIDNLEVIEVIDESRTAKKPGRLGFNKMLEKLSNVEADGIICWKLNRLSRNPIDGGQIQWMLQQGIIKSIITPGREYLPTDNIIMMAVELGMANQFILDLSKDVKRGMNNKVQSGWRPNKAPLGYINDKYGEKGKKEIFKDEYKFNSVRKIWKLMLKGNYTISQLTRIANNELGLTNSKGKILVDNDIYRMLTNIFYCGEFEYNGELFIGNHPKMITKEEYDLTQKILKKKGKPRPKNKRLPFTGIIRCKECGCMITCDEKIKKTSKGIQSYKYYKCTKRKRDVKCFQKPITYNDLNNQLNEIIDSIRFPKVFLDYALDILKKENKIEKSNRTNILKSLKRKEESIDYSLNKLLEAYISKKNENEEIINEKEYKEQKRNLINRREENKVEIFKIQENQENWIENIEDTFNFIKGIKETFNSSNYEEKTIILNTIGSNFYMDNGKIEVEFKGIFKKVHPILQKPEINNQRIELLNLEESKKKISQKLTDFTIWSGILMEVRKSYY